MTDTASWIAGLMRENYDAVGFIPEPTIEHQYIALNRYVLQQDEAGRRVGYLLHSAPSYGRAMTVAQHCIEYDRCRHGYGETTLRNVIARAECAGASCVTARVGTDLDALHFWLSQGFQLREIVPGGHKRRRQIARLWLPLALPLLTDHAAARTPSAERAAVDYAAGGARHAPGVAPRGASRGGAARTPIPQPTGPRLPTP